MTKENIDLFFKINKKYLLDGNLVRQYLEQNMELMSEEDEDELFKMQFVDPVCMLVVSILFGMLGIDSFIRRENKMGIIKLLTGGGFGVLYVLDIIMFAKRTKERNTAFLSVCLKEKNAAN